MAPDQDAVNATAAKIAEEHGLPKERVLSVVSRCAAVGRLTESADYCELERAIGELGADAALKVFEGTDLARLAKRGSAWDYLSFDSTPLLELDELAELLEDFARHLERSRGPIIETGLPEEVYAKALWLDDRLSKLYFVKFPAGYYETRLPAGSTRRTYQWARVRAPWRPKPPWESGRTISAVDAPECVDASTLLFSTVPEDDVVPYENAPLLDGLTCSDAMLLEDSRELLLKAKLDVLDRARQSLTTARARGLWADCCSLIEERLAEIGRPISFFFRMDRLVSACRELRTWVPDPHSIAVGTHGEFLAGGITALLGLVGHCEEELTVGAFRKTAQGLRDALPVGYWAALAVDQDGDRDRALDRFGALEGDLQRFWRDYLTRVSGMATGGRTAGTGPRAPVDTADKEPEPLAGRVTVELHVESGRIKVGGRELKGVTGNMFEILRVASENDGVRLTVEDLELHHISNPRELAPRIQSMFAKNGIADHGPMVQIAKVPRAGRHQWIFCWNAKPDSRTQDRPIRLFTADLH